jgi:hypothetical protein
MIPPKLPDANPSVHLIRIIVFAVAETAVQLPLPKDLTMTGVLK